MWSNISTPTSSSKLELHESNSYHSNNKQDDHLDVKQNNISVKNEDPDYQKTAACGSPLMRYKHAVCSSPQGFIYIHGGRFGNLPLDDDVWRFDAHQNSWLQLETRGEKPPSLQEHTLVEHQEQLYLFGGQVSASNQENSFWRLDLRTNEWHSMRLKSSRRFGTYLGPTNRRGHSAVIYKESMYIFGGFEDFRGSSAQLWQYDLASQCWELRNLSSTSACHPEPRHSHSAIIYEDSMYVYGGLSNLKPLGDLWRWSWREKRWFKERTRGQSPGQLHGHTAIQAFGSMFVFGGERHGRVTRSLWRLNLSNLSWQKIRPKGPRPSPTTWHAAIANPLNILDETNYIIEGANDADVDELMLAHPVNSISDSCCYLIPSDDRIINQHHHHHVVASDLSDEMVTPQGETRLVSSIRPNLNGNNQDENRSGNSSQHKTIGTPATMMSHSKSTSSYHLLQLKQQQQQHQRASASKRRLRLSFLRRNKSASSRGGGSIEIAKKIASSVSTSNIINSSSASMANGANRPHRTEPGIKRHSISFAAEPATMIANNDGDDDVEMVMMTTTTVDNGGAVDQSNQVKILDNLDTDIKEMFHRALSPDELAHQASLGSGQVGDVNLTKNDLVTRDSLTNSQLSSLANTTGGSHEQTSYQTARDNLTSDSNMTLTTGHNNLNTPDMDFKSQRSSYAASYATPQESINNLATRPVEINNRDGATMVRARAPTCRASSGRERPKSETVQSLIDQADRLFVRPAHNVNHREASRVSTTGGAGGGRLAASGGGQLIPNHRFSLQDKSKRHTIHQTMTYYNLYFPEKTANGGGGGGLQSPTYTSRGGDDEMDQDKSHRKRSNDNDVVGARLARDDLSSSTIKGVSSTTAALIGVRDGGSSRDSTSQMDQLSSLEGSSTIGAQSRLDQAPSSESKTLCEQTMTSYEDDDGDSINRDDDDDDSADGNDTNRNNTNRSHNMHPNDRGRDTAASESGDNTSLTFSVIAEFEEDDMLVQYSSPFKPRNNRECFHQELSEHHPRMDSQQDIANDYHNSHDRAGKGCQESGDYAPGREMQHQPANHPTIENPLAHKSSSSGYDSINSYDNHVSPVGTSHQNRPRAVNNNNNQSMDTSHEDSSFRTGSMSFCDDTSPSRQVAINQSKTIANNHHNNTTTSSTTPDSLALTTTSDASGFNSGQSQQIDGGQSQVGAVVVPPSRSLPSSPPEKRGHLTKMTNTTSANNHQQTIEKQLSSSSFVAHQCQRVSSVSRSTARFFGKKKSKTRYWQLCMFVIGGKQGASPGINEPITIWRLYI